MALRSVVSVSQPSYGPLNLVPHTTHLFGLDWIVKRLSTE